MNFFEIFNKIDNIDIVKHGNSFYSPKQLMEFIAPVYSGLMKDKTGRVVILAQNHLDFLVQFLASVFAQKEIYLISDSQKLFLLDFEYTIPSVSDEKCDFEFKKPDYKNTFINIYTSGSSGKPKHVRKNLENLVAESEDMYEEYKKNFSNENKVEVITSAPPHHMFALLNYIVLPLCFCEKFLINTTEVLYPDSVDLNKKLFISTPSFLEQFKKNDIKISSPPYLILTAGDKLKQDIYDYFSSYNSKICEIYGSSETGTIAYKYSYSESYKCFPRVSVSTDTSSQIVIKSPYFMENMIILCDIIEKDGEKKFYLKNRSDRILKIQEKRINAMEIEEYINKSEYIESSYCLKTGDKLACAAVLNQKGKLFYLEKNGGRTKLIKHLKSIVKEKSEIIPQRWKFLPEIPKNSAGKVDKEKIVSLFEKNLSLPLILDMSQEENTAEVKMVFSNTCNFFCGHFDEFPVLPGVVQLYFAHLFAEELFKININKDTVKKVKFSHIIKPDEVVELYLEKDKNNIHYTYKKSETVCSSGTFSA